MVSKLTQQKDFIINYDIKYRMGLGGGSAEEDEGSVGVSPASSLANEERPRWPRSGQGGGSAEEVDDE